MFSEDTKAISLSSKADRQIDMFYLCVCLVSKAYCMSFLCLISNITDCIVYDQTAFQYNFHSNCHNLHLHSLIYFVIQYDIKQQACL